MKQFSKKQSSHLSVVSPVSSSNCPRTLISTTPGYGSCSHQEHETRDILVTISNLEIYCREHRRWWCVSATRARPTISRCVLEDNERDKTDAVPVSGDQHCCYEDSSPGHSSLSSPSGPSSSAGRSSGSHQGRKQEGREQRSMIHWTTEHWISIGSRIWQQGGVGSQTASASVPKNSHDYQNETFNINPF